MTKLTPKQKKFADQFIKTGNATQSYKAAGYSVKSDNAAGVEGHRLLRNPKIKNYVDKKMAELEDKQIATAEEVLKYLTKGIRQELHEEVVVIENIGDYQSEARTITKRISLKESNKCAELLAKRFGLLTDNLNLSGEVGVQIVDDIE